MMTAVMPQYGGSSSVSVTTTPAAPVVSSTRRRSRFTVVSVDDASQDPIPAPVVSKKDPIQITIASPPQSPALNIQSKHQRKPGTEGSGHCEITTNISSQTLYCDIAPTLIESPSIKQPLTDLKCRYAVLQQNLMPNVIDSEPPVTVEYSKNYRRASLPGALRVERKPDTRRKRVSFAENLISCVLEPIKDEHVDELTPRREQELTLLQHDDRWICQFLRPLLSTNNVSGPNVQLVSSTVRQRKLSGMIRIRNQSFEKAVHLRCAFDGNWDEPIEVEATYAFSDNPKAFDLFAFELQLPDHVKSAQFCCRLISNGKEFWDNNGELNYEIKQCEKDEKL